MAPIIRRSLALLSFCLALVAAANTAIEPVPRDAGWLKRHEGFVSEAQKGGINVLFLGDSITDFWRRPDGPQGGNSTWQREFAPLGAANFGISADRTQHVLWRLEHGEVDGIKPKVVVLMIGTNNTGLERGTNEPRNTTAEALQGVTLVVHTLLTKLPTTKILLLGIFPRADNPVSPAQVTEINAALAKMDDGKIVRFLDIGPKFLTDGVLTKEIMPDLLHPNAKGYEIWAAAIKAPLAEMMK
jgi:lysophospholipase L1-like esterase